MEARVCDLCKVQFSSTATDDYECKFCSVDHNGCCYDKEYDCCVACAEKIKSTERGPDRSAEANGVEESINVT